MSISKEELYHNSKSNNMKINPKLIGLEKIALSTGESLLLSNNYSIKRAPDNLMFDPTTHILYNIEYKTNKTNYSYSNGKRQLRDSCKILKSIFTNWDIRNLYIYDNFNIIEVL